MTSKRGLEARLDRLEPGSGDELDIVIRHSLIDEDGEHVGLFAEMRAWEDANGEFHSECTEYDLPNDRGRVD